MLVYTHKNTCISDLFQPSCQLCSSTRITNIITKNSKNDNRNNNNYNRNSNILLTLKDFGGKHSMESIQNI